jgi:hypothetical protein
VALELVLAGFGAGHARVAGLETLLGVTPANNIPVTLASGIGSGPVLTRKCGFPGSEPDQLSPQLVSAETFDPSRPVSCLTFRLWSLCRSLRRQTAHRFRWGALAAAYSHYRAPRHMR